VTDERDAVEDLSPELVRQFLDDELNRTTISVWNALRFFAPHLSEESGRNLASVIARQQMAEIPKIFAGMLDTDQIAKYPSLQMTVTDQKGNHVVMECPKRFERITDLGVAAQTAVLYAILHSPEARAILKAFGFSYTFAQTARNPRGSIILNG
jgi:hypothetical protein